MPVVPQTSSPPSCQHGNHLPAGGPIGELFRDYGEEYIQVYGASRRTIELIRSIRVCRTPALGGKRITCQGCRQVRYQYLSPAFAGAGYVETANARSARVLSVCSGRIGFASGCCRCPIAILPLLCLTI
ncbi:MAG: transposase zinc-binding domain-containing protein [Lewinellaceae bacterium]|nr:transposase zinc-binding domain-containing protein [Lewinellaceae bacterium]